MPDNFLAEDEHIPHPLIAPAAQTALIRREVARSVAEGARALRPAAHTPVRLVAGSTFGMEER